MNGNQIQIALTYGALLERRVRRGAVLLDEYDPEWYERIDTSLLDMADGQFCVLGQRFMEEARICVEGYTAGLSRLGIKAGSEYGFDVSSHDVWGFTEAMGSDDFSGTRELMYSLLAETWIQRITARVRAARAASLTGGVEHRKPYIGEGADGARRSAAVDAEQADMLAWNDPAREGLHASAQRWLEQARRVEEAEALRTTAQPWLDQEAAASK